ncbi:hypothetical protein J5Y09_14850 [Roseomonas sp. PWR1]|uniref:Uncharacterized protein n=1 Tax=Roseomonas nitratireducens TaxID=2820810 RepID=A0ABS4AV60_9PROT|nr:hypothetical protein [Neoroseomonas nitratireducens]MBP0465202.1 hypothetical protein [Neoroseomonas nitratireducens]
MAVIIGASGAIRAALVAALRAGGGYSDVLAFSGASARRVSCPRPDHRIHPPDGLRIIEIDLLRRP